MTKLMIGTFRQIGTKINLLGNLQSAMYTSVNVIERKENA
jgi:hypothetical protein